MTRPLPPGLKELREDLPEVESQQLDKLTELAGLLREAPLLEPPQDLRKKILEALQPEMEARVPWTRRLLAGLRLVAALGACLILGGVYLGWNGHGVALTPPPPRLAAVAVEDASGAPSAALRDGDELVAGQRVRLAASESLEIAWRGQGGLHLEGPGSFLLQRDSVQMDSGVLVSWVDPDDRLGFRVRTPEVEVAVLGTRFRVEHQTGQGSQVSVEEGKVSVTELATREAVQLTPEGRSSWGTPATAEAPTPLPPTPPSPPQATSQPYSTPPPEAPPSLSPQAQDDGTEEALPESREAAQEAAPEAPPAATVVDGF